ncbi:MAG: hypothetical protein WCT05_12460, partial [Lentisphaeria bacterium]
IIVRKGLSPVDFYSFWSDKLILPAVFSPELSNYVSPMIMLDFNKFLSGQAQFLIFFFQPITPGRKDAACHHSGHFSSCHSDLSVIQ